MERREVFGYPFKRSQEYWRDVLCFLVRLLIQVEERGKKTCIGALQFANIFKRGKDSFGGNPLELHIKTRKRKQKQNVLNCARYSDVKEEEVLDLFNWGEVF